MNNEEEFYDEDIDFDEIDNQPKDIYFDYAIKPSLQASSQKPVSSVITAPWAQKYGDTFEKEAALVEGLAVAEWDLDKAMALADIKQKAQANRLLDKIATRKEFMSKLSNRWDVLGKAANRLHDLLDNPNWKAYKAGIDMVMKFTGIDKPDEGILNNNSWEDLVKSYKRGRDDEKQDKKDWAIDVKSWDSYIKWDYEIPEYEVEEPEIPDEVKQQMEDERLLGESLFWEK